MVRHYIRNYSFKNTIPQNTKMTLRHIKSALCIGTPCYTLCKYMEFNILRIVVLSLEYYSRNFSPSPSSNGACGRSYTKIVAYVHQ